MPTEIGWRPANETLGGFDDVTEENPLPVQLMRFYPGAPQPSYYPQAFTYPLAGSASILVKNATGWLASVIATNINAAIRYLQIFNQATAPTPGQVPVISLPIGAGSATVPVLLSLGGDFLGREGGLYLTSGIAIGVSTTAATFTAATVTDHVVSGTFS